MCKTSDHLLQQLTKMSLQDHTPIVKSPEVEVKDVYNAMSFVGKDYDASLLSVSSSIAIDFTPLEPFWVCGQVVVSSKVYILATAIAQCVQLIEVM